MPVATATHDFKTAFHAAIVALYAAAADTQAVHVVFGQPGTLDPDDIVSVGRVSVGQTAATLGTNRSREETLQLDVLFSCYRGGGEEAEQLAHDRAFELLGLIERHVRMTDPTVGGTVRDCALTQIESDGRTPPELIAQGRVLEVTATFTAHARITG